MLLVFAAPASAVNRFAEVGGDGAEPCAITDPCSIEVAINDASGATNDDVTLLGGLPPNPYVVTTTTLSLESNVTVHGMAGARPVIETDVGLIGVELNAGSVLRDVIVEFSGINNPAIRLTGGGTLERVTGVATDDSGSASGGCQTFGAGSYSIRDSVCWHADTTGLNGGGIEARNSSATGQTLVLRNVTAVTANTRPGVRAIATAGGDVTVNATNVIALSAAGEDVEVPDGFGGHVNLNHSNYDSEDEPGAMSNVITDPGTGTADMNQTTPPAFVNAAAGDFHQLPTSAGTIDLGTATGVLGGELDFDGQPRIIGPLPDVGADELRHATTTAVACTPTSFTVGTGSTSCTATVTDTGSAPTSAPTGVVSFGSGGGGSFSAGTCSLSPDGDGVGSCSVVYTPTAVGTGSHQITGSYAGDTAHEPSPGSTQVGVLARSTSTSVACSPVSLTLGAGSSTCTATVTETAGNPTPPTLNVGFTTNGAGLFSSSSCALNGSGNQASCSVVYTPTAVGSGSHQITASYSGDPTHQNSQGSGLLGVISRPPPFDLAAAIKKCKKKFPKGKNRKKCIKRAKKRARA